MSADKVEERADEAKAEQEIQTAIDAARDASADERISGLVGTSSAPLYLQIRPGARARGRYDTDLRPGEKPLLLVYFAIKGLGESIRLLLAECGLPYDTFAVVSGGGSDQSNALGWRTRSPNGLLPMISGLGLPRSRPISQSGAIIRYLARRLGMNGTTPVEEAMSDVLYETAKDMFGQREKIFAGKKDEDTSAKGPFALASRIEKMLSSMADPRDHDAALSYGQIELLHVLLSCEARRAGAVREVLGSKVLDDFRVATLARPGIASYLASPGCFPHTRGALGKEGGYSYDSGPIRRGDVQ